MSKFTNTASVLAIATAALIGISSSASADIVHLDDVIVDGSICVGQDCVNGESFGFDTIRLKENNLRIRAVDTSNSASFPTRDWQITFNDSSNGGANKFSIDDIDGGRTPFTIEAGAPSHSLYVEDGGRIGFGTSTPVVELHLVDGDTPTLRLQQDGSSGFTPQTFDVAANETNFFIRDVTNGSALPFRIRPGAPTSSIDVAASGNVGMGTTSPENTLHLSSGETRTAISFENSAQANDFIIGWDNDEMRFSEAGSGVVEMTITDGKVGVGTNAPDETLHLSSGSTRTAIEFQNTSTVNNFQMAWDNSQMRLSQQGSGVIEMAIDSGGDVTIAGSLVTGTGGSCTVGTPCDGVFDPEVYTVPSITEHAAAMWRNQYLPAVGSTLPGEPINVTQKLTGVLNELEHAHIYIEQLNQRLVVLETAQADGGTQ